MSEVPLCDLVWVTDLGPVGHRSDGPLIATRYRGTSIIKKRLPVGPYRCPMPRALWWSYGGGRFLISEVPLYLRFGGGGGGEGGGSGGWRSEQEERRDTYSPTQLPCCFLPRIQGYLTNKKT